MISCYEVFLSIGTKHLVPEGKDGGVISVQVFAMMNIMFDCPEIEELECRMRQHQIGVHQNIGHMMNKENNQEGYCAYRAHNPDCQTQQAQAGQILRRM